MERTRARLDLALRVVEFDVPRAAGLARAALESCSTDDAAWPLQVEACALLSICAARDGDRTAALTHASSAVAAADAAAPGGASPSDGGHADGALRDTLGAVRRLKERLQAENVRLREEIRLISGPDEIVGESKAILETLDLIRSVARTESTVLVTGETGSGKELVARTVHRLSQRADRPIVKVDCSSVNAGLVESELFGHVKGAFTGAHQSRKGRFEVADGSTLFLDEIGELPAPVQSKLLRVLQDGEFEPVGSSKSVRVDVRVIAATNRDLVAEVDAGRFRSDLYFRLNVFPIHVPPLRERLSDVRPLAEHICADVGRCMGRQFDGIAPDFLKWMEAYSWPGNVRELRNLIERSAILSPGALLLHPARAGAVATEAPAASAPAPQEQSERLEDALRAHIQSVLERSGWTIAGPTGAAARLGLPPSTLRSRMEKLGLRKQPPL